MKTKVDKINQNFDIKGITLIALIITIIVMLILVTVTIQILVNSRLFNHAQNSLSSWDAAQINEQKLSNGEIGIIVGDEEYNSVDEYLNDAIPVLTTDRSILQIGDYIQYTPDSSSPYSISSTVSGHDTNQSISQENLKWRILDIHDDGSIELISDYPIATNVYFKGPLGYNNGVYILNDLCEKLYSNNRLGAIGRSINVEDIEEKFSSTGISAKNTYINGEVAKLTVGTYIQNVDTSNNTITYVTRTYYPDLYQYENGSGINTTNIKADGIDRSSTYSGYINGITTNSSNNADTNGLTVTYNANWIYQAPTDYFIDDTFHELIFNTGKDYWLASRCVFCYSEDAIFNLYYINGETLIFHYLFFSDGVSRDPGVSIRPIVTLPYNIKISTSGGTIDSPREISL